MKNAQITIFLIIGLVLLLGVGFLIYMASITPEKKGEEKVAAQALRQAAVQPIKDYINTCLDIVSSDALELIGKQGGRLYLSQGSTTPDPGSSQIGSTFINHDDLKLFYSIVPPQGTVGTLFFSDIPEYPWPRFPYVGNNVSDIGYFGMSLLPPLYRKFGAGSIQEQLETYISSNVIGCFAAGDFPGFNISAGIPNTTMIIAENLTHLRQEEYISFVLDWPVKIKESGTNAEITLDKFSVNYPIALGRIYYTIKGIIEDEISNMSYEPGTAPAYYITINKNVHNKDDIVIYQDKKYNLKAKPYEFRILRKNRAPALYWIDQGKIDQFAYCSYIVEFGLSGNKIVASPDLEDDDYFPLNLTAVDPDNDAISFRLHPSNPKVDEHAVASYAAQPAQGGLIITVYASDNEFEDYQKIRIIPKGCPQS